MASDSWGSHKKGRFLEETDGLDEASMRTTGGPAEIVVEKCVGKSFELPSQGICLGNECGLLAALTVLMVDSHVTN